MNPLADKPQVSGATPLTDKPQVSGATQNTDMPQVSDAAQNTDMPQASDAAQNTLSAVNRDQLDFYNSTYKPLEDKLMAQVKNPDYAGNFSRASSQVDNAFAASAGAETRTLGRYGIQQTGARKASSTRKRGLSKMLAQVGTKNAVRTSTLNQTEQAKQALLGIGTDTQRKAQGLFEASATSEANRNAANRNISAQNNSNTMSTIGTVATVAAMMM